MRIANSYIIATGLCLIVTLGPAYAEPTKEAVAMQIRTNFVPSTTRCALDTFVAAGPSSQPEVGATLCAIGGPFGNGMIGTAAQVPSKFTGSTIHLDRTFVFNNGADKIFISADFNGTSQVQADNRGINYFDGTWEITGGTGAFEGLRGKGSLTVALGSTSNLPPPPEYGRQELTGWVTGGASQIQFRTPPK